MITIAVYWPVGRFNYINCDDGLYASNNPHIQHGLTPADMAWAFGAVVASNWHPVTCLSLMLDCQLFGNNAEAHHLVNLLFHVANTLLLFLVWRQMTGEVWPSALVAALFAWHPLHIESVAWISERKDVLSVFFGLLTLWAYACYAQRQSRAGNNGPALDSRLLILDYCLALIFFALGLMSKPMLVTWPFVLLLLDYWPLRRITSFSFKTPILRRLILEKLPFLALTVASSVITFIVQRNSGAMESLGHIPISGRIGNALVSYVRYLGKMVWPDQLAFFYPYHLWATWQVVGSAALLVFITLAAVWQARHCPFLIVGWLWYLGTLVPVIGIVQVGIQAMADRYTYIPLIGVSVMIAWAAKELGGRQPYAKLIRGTMMTAVLAACLVLTSRQLRYWRNNETLYRHTLGVTTRNVMAHFLLGEALTDEGKLSEAAAQLRAALQAAPWHPLQTARWYWQIHCGLAMILVQQGQSQKGIQQYHEALHYDPDQPLVLNNLAWLLATSEDSKIRNGAEAVRLAERACAVTHYQITAYLGTLAAAYAEAGRFEDAVKTEEDVITSTGASGQTNQLEKNRQLLELYRAGRPYHGKTD